MQGQKVSTHPSLVPVHVSASQRRRAVDGEPAAIALCREGEHTKRFSGALEESSWNGSTHRSRILVNLASIEVGLSIYDVEPSARLHAESEHMKRSSGALEDMSGKGQNVSTHHSLIAVHVGVG